MLIRKKSGICPTCQRNVSLTFHHLIPKKLHRRDHFRKYYLKAQLNQGINICRKCYSGIHDLYDEMTLAKQLNTLEAILNDAPLIKHFDWVAKQRIKE